MEFVECLVKILPIDVNLLKEELDVLSIYSTFRGVLFHKCSPRATYYG